MDMLEQLPIKVEPTYTQEEFLRMVRYQCRGRIFERDWGNFPPLCLGREDCYVLAEILPNSRFKLLSLTERGLELSDMERFAREVQSFSPDLSSLVGQAPTPIHSPIVSGQAYPAFSLVPSERNRGLVIVTGFLVTVDPLNGQLRDRFRDFGHHFTEIAKLKPWTFFLDNSK